MDPIEALAWTPVLLHAAETTHEAAQFAAAMFPYLDRAKREAVERAMLAIGANEINRDREPGLLTSRRVLVVLPRNLLVTHEAKQRAEEPWPPPGALPPGDAPLVPVPQTTEKPELDPYESRVQPVRTLIDRTETPLNLPEVETALVPALQNLRSALPAPGPVTDLSTRWAALAWEDLARACYRAAGLDGLSCQTHTGRLIRDLLLEAARHPVPNAEANANAEKTFENRHRLSTGPRRSAADGLAALAFHQDCVDPAIEDVLERLSEDPVPDVRFEVARRVHALFGPNKQRMWRIIEHIAATDCNVDVLRALVTPLQWLASADPIPAVACVRVMLQRTQGPGDARPVREDVTVVLLDAYVHRGDARAAELLHEIVSNPEARSDEAGRLPNMCRSWLVHGPTDRTDTAADTGRQRVISLLTQLARSILEKLPALLEQLAKLPASGRSPEDLASARNLDQIAESLATEFYFGSGASDPPERDELPVIGARQKRLLEEAGPLLDDLARIGRPAMAHSLIEMYDALLPLDPRTVFLRIATVVRGGEQHGYEFESLAASTVVRLVERFLAQHRSLVRRDDEIREAVLSVLNAFVRAGWPAAQRLTYRLDELSR